jgi:Holliday junction resolvase
MPVNVRDKGKRAERELVKLLHRQGYVQARRVYGSGAIGTALAINNDTGQALKGDVYVPELKLELEVKNRADYPRWLDDLEGPLWLEDDEGPVLVSDGAELERVLRQEARCPTRSFPTKWFRKWRQQSPILAIKRSKKGWTLVAFPTTGSPVGTSTKSSTSSSHRGRSRRKTSPTSSGK